MSRHRPMSVSARSGWLRGLVAALFVAALAACGGGGGEGGTGAQQVGAAGARIESADGASVEIPAGALADAVTVRIAKDSVGAPPLPADLEAAGAIYALTPHGVTFAKPATVRVPFDPGIVGTDGEPVLLKAQPGGGWVRLLGARREGNTMVVPTEGFSYYTVTICTPDSRGSACRSDTYRADLTAVDPAPSGGAITITEPRYLRLNFAYTVPRVTYGLEYTLWANLPGSGLRKVASGPLPVSPVAFSVPFTARENGTATLYVTMSCVSQTVPAIGPACSPAPSGPTEPITRPFDVRSNLLDVRVNIPANASAAALAPMVTDQPDDVDAAAGETQARFSVTSATPVLHQWQESSDGGNRWVDLGTWPIKLAGNSATRVLADPAESSTLDVVADLLGSRPLTAASNGRLYRAVLQNDFGLVVSRAARLTVGPPEPPVLVQSPQSIQVLQRQTASFSAVFRGRPAPTVCWERRPAGATTWQATNVCGGTYTTGLLTVADSGTQVRAVARNAAGSATSDEATLTVGLEALAPAIVGAPQPVSVPVGGTALFAAGVTGSAPLSYQWQRNGIDIAGANGPVLSLPGVSAGDDGNLYRLVVANNAGTAATVPVRLTVTAAPGTAPPAIVTEPADLDVGSGSDATFAVGATSVDAMSFQWLRDGTPIPGATAAAYTLRGVGTGDVASYSVQVTNTTGTVTSRAAALRLTAAVVTAPTIAVAPASVVVALGSHATLAVAASGTAPLAYEWRRNGVVVAGADQAVLSLNAVDANSAGSYTVRVSNGAGSVTSAAAQVLLLGAPAITTQPAATTAAEGASFAFSVGATGPELRYQWVKDGVAVAGATASTYSGTAALADNGSVFQAVVYNGSGLVFSSTAVLTVTPQSTWRPSVVIPGTTAAFDPSVGIDSQGNALAVWHDGLRLYAASGTVAGGWGAPTTIDGDQFTDGYDARVAVASDGSAIVAWGYYAGGGLYRGAARARTGSGWTAPVDLRPSSNALVDMVRVAVDATGRGVVVWQADLNVYARVWNGTWQDPVALDPGVSVGMLQVTLNANGVGAVSYVTNGNTELRVVPVDLASGFGPPQSVRSGANNLGSARVAVDGSGNRIAVWVEGVPGGYDLRAASSAAGGNWSAPTTLHADVGFPLDTRFSMAGGAGGHVLVAWIDAETTNDETLYALRFDPATGWAPRQALSTAGRAGAILPQAAVNATGQMALLWSQADAADQFYEIAGRFFDGTTWSAAKRVQSSTNDLPRADQMGLALSANGTAVGVWVESTPSGDDPVAAAFWN